MSIVMKWLEKPTCTINVQQDYDSLSHTGAKIVIDSILSSLSKKDSVVLVPSAGKTPTTMYRILATQYRDVIAWERVEVWQMDEYIGMASTHPNSMANYLLKELVYPLGIKKFVTLNDLNGDLCQTPIEYEKKLLEKGGIDLVIHGLGRNGHIGFNEPGSDWLSETRIVSLHEATLEANFSGSDIKLREKYVNAVTLGLSCLTKARHSLLLISGSGKSKSARRLLQEEPSIELPASSLCINEKVDIIIDEQSLHSNPL